MLLNAPTGWTIYALAWNTQNGHVWDGSAFVAYVDGSRGSYAVAGVEGVSGTGVYTFDFGSFDQAAQVAYYKQSGGSPALSDLCIASDDFLKPVGEVTLSQTALNEIVSTVTSGVVGDAG